MINIRQEMTHRTTSFCKDIYLIYIFTVDALLNKIYYLIEHEFYPKPFIILRETDCIPVRREIGLKNGVSTISMQVHGSAADNQDGITYFIDIEIHFYKW